MPITTINEVNELLQVSGYDSLIYRLIPKVQELVITKVNSFANPKVWIQSSTLSFDVSTNEINDSDSQFLENYFTGGLDIRIIGSLYNDGLYSIQPDGATAGTLKLNEDIKAYEPEGEVILIQALKFPKDISLAAAEYISNKLDKNRMTKSFSLGDYSEVKITSEEVMNVFAPWKDIYVGLG